MYDYDDEKNDRQRQILLDILDDIKRYGYIEARPEVSNETGFKINVKLDQYIKSHPVAKYKKKTEKRIYQWGKRWLTYSEFDKAIDKLIKDYDYKSQNEIAEIRKQQRKEMCKMSYSVSGQYQFGKRYELVSGLLGKGK